jgi:hypothetical protein
MPKPGQVLADGEYFGFLNSVDLDRRTVQVNFAQWLSGHRASRAALADGYIDSPDESVPNDYYVHDDVEKFSALPLSPHVLVTVWECNKTCGQYEGTLEGLATSLAATGHRYQPYGAYQGRTGKYWLKLRFGQVVRIDEIFTP